MTALKALVTAEIDFDALKANFPDIAFECKGYAQDFKVLPHDDLVGCVGEYDILISEFDTIDAEVLARAERLKLLVCCRGGVGSVVDVEGAHKRGIVVRNTPGRNATAVAEYVIGQIIAHDRFLPETNRLVHEDVLQARSYRKPEEYRDSLWGMDETSPYHAFRGRGLQNLIIGVVGYGRVGRVVADFAQTLGMRVLVYDHHLTELIPELNIVDFETLLGTADIVSLHCSNPRHRVLMSDAEFSAMRAGSWLINTARGDLVDEYALGRALESGHLGRAILDVTQEEPLPLKSPLISYPNCTITPHIAGATDVVIDNVTKIAIACIEQFLEGERDA